MRRLVALLQDVNGPGASRGLDLEVSVNFRIGAPTGRSPGNRHDVPRGTILSVPLSPDIRPSLAISTARPARAGLLALGEGMTGTTRSSAGLDERRRRLLYRAWHRGTREMDLIMGRFADAVIGELSEADIDAFETLSEVPDPDLYAWLSGGRPVPAEYDMAHVPPLAGLPSRGDGMNIRAPHARSPAELLAPGRPLTFADVADGAEGFVLADLARAVAAQKSAPATSLLVVCRDGARMAQLHRALAFFAPEIAVAEFPAWDCQPYDRASPHPGIVAQRMTALARLARLKGQERPSVVLTTVNAIVQRVPARGLVAGQAFSAMPGNMLAMDGIVGWLELNGYVRASTVREAGEYAVRGGIIDLFPPGRARSGAARLLRRHAGIDPHLRSGDPAQPATSSMRSTSCRSPNSSSPPRRSARSAPAM